MSLATYGVYVNYPADNVCAGDYHHMFVIAEDGDQARKIAFNKAVNDGGTNTGVWMDEFVTAVVFFDEAPADATEGVRSVEVWGKDEATQVTCRHCSTPLAREAGLWVDAISGDDGGTYDHCPENGAHAPKHPA